MADSHYRCSRRLFIAALSSVPVASLLIVGGKANAQQPVPNCSAPDDDGMRATSSYVDLSPHGPARDCRNCDSWIANHGSAACGGCTLISGPISPVGYCDSWALDPAAEPPRTPADASPAAVTN